MISTEITASRVAPTAKRPNTNKADRIRMQRDVIRNTRISGSESLTAGYKLTKRNGAPAQPAEEIATDGAGPQKSVDFSIVVPCFNEEASIPHLLEVLVPILEREVGKSWELVFINDGSRDRTLDIVLEAHHRDARIKGVSLSRNFGHQSAVACGLAFVSGEVVGLMDCDMQDSPEVLVQLFKKVKSEGFDVAYAVRQRRKGHWFKKWCYRTFYRIMSRLAEHSFPQDAGDFSVFNRRVHQTIMSLPETLRVLRGLRSWVGFKQCEIAVDRPERKHGETKYSFFKLVSLALNSLTSFSYAPLRMASLIGLFMGVLSLVLGGLFILNRIFPQFTILSYSIGANPGLTTVILYLSLISSMLFFCLGVMGEYLVVMLKEIKRRPAAIAQTVIGDLSLQSHGSVIAFPAKTPLQSTCKA